MTAAGFFSTILNACGILKELEAAGLRVEVNSDFVAYRKMRDKQRNRLPIYPVFDVSSSFIDASNGFWICAFNEQNELAHTQVIRMLDLRDTCLNEHLHEHRHKYLTPGMVKDPDEVTFASLESLKTIRGRVCYHGEFWLKDGEDGLRGQGYTALMSRLLLEIALKIWSPDFFFGFVPQKLAMKGIPFRYGYSRCEVGAWLVRNEIVAEEAFVWMSRADLQQFIATVPRQVSHEKQIMLRAS